MAIIKNKGLMQASGNISRDNYKKTFYQELIRVLKAFDMYDCFKRLPPKSLKAFTTNIVRPIRFEKDPEVESHVLTALRKDVKEIIDNCYLDLKILNSELAYRDFLTAGVALHGDTEDYFGCVETDIEKWVHFHTILDVMITRDDFNPILLISQHMTNMCYICTSLDTAYYWLDPKPHLPDRLEPYSCLVYILKKTPAEKKIATIEGQNRPVFRLGISERKKIEWASVPAQEFGIDSKGTEALPVYIQSHALNRLWERLAPLKKPDIQVLLYDAFTKREFSQSADGAHLAALRYNGAKLGYLIFDIVDYMVIVKTFLFLTQNGTPEGEVLNKKFDLSKYSKTYLEIDKLYTFVKTDIYQDEALKSLFLKCGCGDLFNVWKAGEKESISFDKNYAKNLKKIFLPVGDY